MGKIEYPLKVEGEFKSSKQIENIVVANYNGNVIFLKDVATVKDGPKDTNLEESINGKKGARMFVMKKSGGNTVKIAKDVRKELKKIEKTLPKDVKIDVIMDSSEFIEGSINNLTETLFYAFLFVTVVVFFFLGHFRATIIIILTIPISLVVAFIYLYITGNS
jgi:HAE1 family hydrophobic/amphiphilic exporter-1